MDNFILNYASEVIKDNSIPDEMKNFNQVAKIASTYVNSSKVELYDIHRIMPQNINKMSLDNMKNVLNNEIEGTVETSK